MTFSLKFFKDVKVMHVKCLKNEKHNIWIQGGKVIEDMLLGNWDEIPTNFVELSVSTIEDGWSRRNVCIYIHIQRL